VPDLFADYQLGAAYDEMFALPGVGAHAEGEAALRGGHPTAHDVRPRYRPVYRTLSKLDAREVVSRADLLARSYVAQGVTFDFAGEERPFPIDVVPRVISPGEWEHIDTGVSQRVRALEAFLADIYGKGEVIKDGVVPKRLIRSSANFVRAATGIQPPNGVRCHVSGIDIVRDTQGEYRVLEDNVRTPSGVSYVIANRQAMQRSIPELFQSMRVRPVNDYPQRLRAALIASAPEGVPEPTIVVLTPGVYNSAYFEHTLLARLMGVELVEGRDLFCAAGRVYMRTTRGSQRVDVIYRRVDDEFLDPVQFRADSMLGVPGLVGCARRGKVTLANAIGNGVADDKLVYTYVPDLVRYYLNEEPILKNVDTWRLEDPQALTEVLDRLDELVVKPVDGSGGKGILIGPRATKAELEAMRQRLIADPRGWIAQPVVQLSTAPTLVGDEFQPRHVDLRPFAVNLGGGKVSVLPGGLTRVALPAGELIVNSSQGGGSKDTWVLEGKDKKPRRGGGAGLGGHSWVRRTHSTDDGHAIEYEYVPPGLPLTLHPSDEKRELRQQQQQQQQTGQLSLHRSLPILFKGHSPTAMPGRSLTPQICLANLRGPRESPPDAATRLAQSSTTHGPHPTKMLSHFREDPEKRVTCGNDGDGEVSDVK